MLWNTVLRFCNMFSMTCSEWSYVIKIDFTGDRQHSATFSDKELDAGCFGLLSTWSSTYGHWAAHQLNTTCFLCMICSYLSICMLCARNISTFFLFDFGDTHTWILHSVLNLLWSVASVCRKTIDCSASRMFGFVGFF